MEVVDATKKDQCLVWLRENGLEHTRGEFNEATGLNMAQSQYSSCRAIIRQEMGLKRPETKLQPDSMSNKLKMWFHDDLARLDIGYADYKRDRKKAVSRSLFSHVKSQVRKESHGGKKRKQKAKKTVEKSNLNGLSHLAILAKEVLTRGNYTALTFELLPDGKMRMRTREVREETFDV